MCGCECVCLRMFLPVCVYVFIYVYLFNFIFVFIPWEIFQPWIRFVHHWCVYNYHWLLYLVRHTAVAIRYRAVKDWIKTTHSQLMCCKSEQHATMSRNTCVVFEFKLNNKRSRAHHTAYARARNSISVSECERAPHITELKISVCVPLLVCSRKCLWIFLEACVWVR